MIAFRNGTRPLSANWLTLSNIRCRLPAASCQRNAALLSDKPDSEPPDNWQPAAGIYLCSSAKIVVRSEPSYTFAWIIQPSGLARRLPWTASQADLVAIGLSGPNTGLPSFVSAQRD